MQRSFLTGLLALPLFVTPPAEALEAWTSFEVRVPLNETTSFWPHTLKIANDFRYGANYPGIGQASMRVGPSWELNEALAVAAHVTSYVAQSRPEYFRQEYRAELEPTLRWRWGEVQGANRLRLEQRIFPTETRWRWRNRLQFTYQPKGWKAAPFLSEEAYWENGVYNQNRVNLGASWARGAHSKVSLSYVWRSKVDGSAWNQTHALRFGYTFSPKIEPLFGGGAGP